MKILDLVIYLCIGGALFGLIANQMKKDCPNDRIENVDVAAFVATWPAFFVAALVYNGDGKPPKCDAPKEAAK